MKKLNLLLPVFILTLYSYNSKATVIYSDSSSTGVNWSDPTTWVGGTVPGKNDTVIISKGHSVIVDGNDSCKRLIIRPGDEIKFKDTRIIMYASNTLYVGGDVILNGNDGVSDNQKCAIQWNSNAVLTIKGDLIFNNNQSSKDAQILLGPGASKIILEGNIILNSYTYWTLGTKSTVVYQGSTAQTLNIGSDIKYNNIILKNSSATGVTLGNAITDANVTGNIEVQSGIFDNNGLDIATTDKDTFKLFAGTTFKVTGTSNFPSSNFVFVLDQSSTVEYNSNNSQTIAGYTGLKYGNLTLTSTSPTTKTLGGNIDVNGDLNIGSFITLDVSSNFYNINLAGNLIHDGLINNRSNTFTFDGTTTISGATPPQFYNVVINNASSLTSLANDTIKIKGNFTNDGTFTHNNGIVKFNGNTTISGSSTTEFNTIEIAASSTLTAPSSGTIRIDGNWINNGTFTHNNSTVEFNGNTTIGGSSVTDFNNVTINSVKTLTGPSSATFRVAGNWTNNGTFTHNKSTIEFNDNTTISGTSTNTFYTIKILNASTLTAPSGNMNIEGDWINNGTFNHNNGTVTFNGTTLMSGTSTNSFYNLTISTDSSLTAPASGTIEISANWTNNGFFTHNNSTIVFNGTADQTISNSKGSVNFYNMTISGAGDYNLSGDIIVENTLNMISGNINTGTDTLILGTSTTNEGILSYSGGRIIGKFRRWANTTSSDYIFPIGTSSNDNTAIITFINLTGGTITGEFLASDPGSSGLPIADPPSGTDTIYNQFTDGYWKLTTGNGLSSNSYDAKLKAAGFLSYAIDTFTRVITRSPGGNWTADGTNAGVSTDTVKRTGISTLPAELGLGNVCNKPNTSAINGKDSVCINVTEAYKVTPTPGSSYNWIVTGGSIISGQGTDSINVTWGATGQVGSVKVVETNSCGTKGDTVSLTVNIHPLPTSAISGPSNVFINTTRNYSVTARSGYTYNWSVGPLGTITSGNGTNSISVSWGGTTGNDTIGVVASMGCGSADSVGLAVVVNGLSISNGTGGGNWSNPSTWQSGTVPLSTDSVIIAAGDSVIVDGDSTVSYLTLNKPTTASNTVLTIPNSITLTVNNDLLIEGDGTANSIVYMLGSGSADINGDITYNASNASSATIDMSNGTSNIYLAGTINLNTAGQLISSSTSTVIFDGSSAQTITSGSLLNYNNISITNTSGVTTGQNLSLTGNLSIAASAILSSNDTISLQGNFSNNGTFNAGTGAVKFNGTSDQTIGGTSLTSFNDIIIENSGFNVLLNRSEEITGTLLLNSGTFNTNSQSFTLISTSTKTARIGQITGGSITGDIIVQRYVKSGKSGWKLLSSPVSGTTLLDWDNEIYMSGVGGADGNACCPIFYSVWEYDETVSGPQESGYDSVTTTTKALTPGKGFWVWVGTSLNNTTAFTFNSIGPANTGNISLPVSYTNTYNSGDGWNLVGNPYPCEIDWDAAGWTKTNIDNAIYIWNPDLEVYASYVNGVGANGGSQYIASHQGFWVKANAANPTLNISESVKVSTNPTFFKQSNPNNYFKLKVTDGNYSDETLIRFSNSATNSFDSEWDAYKLRYQYSPAPNISSVINNVDYSINSIPDLSSDLDIAIRVIAKNSSNHTINVKNLENIPPTSCLILEDLLTGSQIDLKSTSSYTFYIEDTTQSPRFILHIGAPVLKGKTNALCYNGTGSAFAKAQGSGPFDYLWLNQNGDTVRYVTGINSADTLYSTAGTYTVIVNKPSSICPVVSDTITISEPSEIVENANITNATCYNYSDGSINLNVTGGTPPYTYQWTTGDSTSYLNNLSAGTYIVTITDFNNCSINDTINITEPLEVIADIIAPDTIELAQGGIVLFTNNSSNANAYLWDFGDGQTSTIASPTHIYDSAGTYIVTLIAYNGQCSDTSTTSIYVKPEVSGIIANNKDENYKIYQLDNEVLIKFNFNEKKTIKIKVYDILGKKLSKSITINALNQSKKIKISQKPGIYFIQFSGDINRTHKIVIGN